jgi:hypothetical protein
MTVSYEYVQSLPVSTWVPCNSYDMVACVDVAEQSLDCTQDARHIDSRGCSSIVLRQIAITITLAFAVLEPLAIPLHAILTFDMNVTRLDVVGIVQSVFEGPI